MTEIKVLDSEGNNKESNVYEILMHSPAAICIFRGIDYTLEFANDFYLQTLGKDRQIVGKPIFESFPELKTQGLKEIIDGVVKSAKPFRLNDHEFYINSKKSYFNCVYHPLKNKDGNVTGTLVVFTDVTQQVLQQNKNMAYQNSLSNELAIANIELAYQKIEKGKRALELGLANKELIYQDKEKEKRAAELVIADIELDFQNKEKNKAKILIKK